MDKKVLVTIKSIQTANNQDEKIEMITAGKYYKVEDDYYVKYDETEISGMEGTVTTVKIGRDEVSLTRTGTTNGSMNFKKGMQDISLYSTPYGVLEIGIVPFQVKINVDENGGEVMMKYGLASAGQQVSINELYIEIQENNN